LYPYQTCLQIGHEIVRGNRTLIRTRKCLS
jgi:hypothetical protein